MRLGCNQSKALRNGPRNNVTYDMEQFLRSCVDRYLEVGDVKLNKVVTLSCMKKQRITSHGSLPNRGRQSCAIGVTILCPPTVLPRAGPAERDS